MRSNNKDVLVNDADDANMVFLETFILINARDRKLSMTKKNHFLESLPETRFETRPTRVPIPIEACNATQKRLIEHTNLMN